MRLVVESGRGGDLLDGRPRADQPAAAQPFGVMPRRPQRLGDPKVAALVGEKALRVGPSVRMGVGVDDLLIGDRVGRKSDRGANVFPSQVWIGLQ